METVFDSLKIVSAVVDIFFLGLYKSGSKDLNK
jgi:hypothetical protein